MRPVRPITARPSLVALAAIWIALLGLTLPRFGAFFDPEAASSSGRAADGTSAAAMLADGDSADDFARYAAPVANGTIDDAAVLQRATEVLQRTEVELGWSKARTLATHAQLAAQGLVGGDPVRAAEREVSAHASPLLRWRLAHSTSSALG